MNVILNIVGLAAGIVALVSTVRMFGIWFLGWSCDAGILGIVARHYNPPATNGTIPPEGQIHGDATATADDVSDGDDGHPSLS